MKRYYLSPVIGSGSETDAYRPKIADYGVTWQGTIPTDSTGRPTFPWTLVLVDAADHAALVADAALTPLLDYPLGRTVAGLAPAEKARLRAALTARGVSTTVVANASSYADVILRIGRALEPTFRVR